MKTFSEVQRERAEQHLAAKEEERLRRERDVYYLEQHVETRSIPLYQGKGVMDGGATDDTRKGFREDIRSGRAEASDVACDHCGTQLFYPSPHVVTLTGVRQISCPGCGWLGWL